ncbi:cytidylate kinase [Sarcina sp. DSM 11001]|nr:cytidylate kinase [Sarcina sp. DSM 11001]
MINIAIDGPAGAGKSTIAKRVAKELSYIYVDTGAMYRAMALYLHRLGISAEDTEKIAESCSGAEISIEYIDGEQVVLLGGENVNPLLRTREVSEMASKSSAVPQVRTRLVQLQQELGKKQNVVMDGRDIGTVVLPDAQVKIYLTASVDVRARRRWLELKEKGEDPVFEEIAREIEERDNRDMTREVSPLRIADDAVLVDSSAMTIEEVAEYILKIVHSRV